MKGRHVFDIEYLTTGMFLLGWLIAGVYASVMIGLFFKNDKNPNIWMPILIVSTICIIFSFYKLVAKDETTDSYATALEYHKGAPAEITIDAEAFDQQVLDYFEADTIEYVTERDDIFSKSSDYTTMARLTKGDETLTVKLSPHELDNSLVFEDVSEEYGNHSVVMK